jgi:hypothetical protein
MKVICKCALDIQEEFPTELPVVPVVGQKIMSATKHGKFQLCLDVVAVTWIPSRLDKGEWIPEIELHCLSKKSIMEFYQWYAPLVGKNISAFI